MHEFAESARKGHDEKIKRYMSKESGRIDASDYKVPGEMHTEKKTGPEQPKEVTGNEGASPVYRADRKPRASGGRTKRDVGGQMPMAPSGIAAGQAIGSSVVPGALLNARGTPTQPGLLARSAGLKEGGKADHWIAGAIKHPGALHKELHVPEGKKIPAKKLVKAEHSKNPVEAKRAHLAETLKGLHKAEGGSVPGNDEVTGTRPTGGRLARSDGGQTLPIARADGGVIKSKKTKPGMTVNILIGQKREPSASGLPGLPPPMPPSGPPAAPVMPAGGPPPMPMPPPGGPAGGGMPMSRKYGGRTSYPIDSGSLGGKARLEKIASYGIKP